MMKKLVIFWLFVFIISPANAVDEKYEMQIKSFLRKDLAFSNKNVFECILNDGMDAKNEPAFKIIRARCVEKWANKKAGYTGISGILSQNNPGWCVDHYVNKMKSAAASEQVYRLCHAAFDPWEVFKSSHDIKLPPRISETRRLYPNYDDLSDCELTRAVYNTYGSPYRENAFFIVWSEGKVDADCTP